MATPEELKIIYDPPFGALYPEKTAQYLSGIPPVDAFGGDEAMATDTKLIELRLGQLASGIRNIEVGLRIVAYEASVLRVFAEKHPKEVEDLPENIREAIKTIDSWLTPKEDKKK